MNVQCGCSVLVAACTLLSLSLQPDVHRLLLALAIATAARYLFTPIHGLACSHVQVHLLVAAAAATEAALPQGNNQGGSNLSQMPMKIEFDNKSDPDATVISISGPDQTDLLMQLTGAFNALELTVASANIRTDRHGGIYDQFRVMDADEKKVSTRAPSFERQPHARQLLGIIGLARGCSACCSWA